MSTDRFNRKYNYTTTTSSDKFSKFSKFEGMDRLSELLNKWVITQAEYDEGMDELRTPENTKVWHRYILENLIWNDKIVRYIKYVVLGSILLFVIYYNSFFSILIKVIFETIYLAITWINKHF